MTNEEMNIVADTSESEEVFQAVSRLHCATSQENYTDRITIEEQLKVEYSVTEPNLHIPFYRTSPIHDQNVELILANKKKLQINIPGDKEEVLLSPMTPANIKFKDDKIEYATL